MTSGRSASAPSSGPNAAMVVIPGGECVHGISEAEARDLARAYPGYDPSRYEPEMPQRRVAVEEFAMHVYPVTCGDYRFAVEAGVVEAPILWGHPNWYAPDHPVVGVSWYEACAYSEWRGYSLPTEVQWEKAASWDPVRKTKSRFPWGSDWRADRSLNAEGLLGRPITSRDDWTDAFWTNGEGARRGRLERVGLRDDRSAYGVRMMSGHAWEWTRDAYVGPDPAIEEIPAGVRAVRGGSWVDDWNSCRTTYRTWSRPEAWRFGPTDVGFRCVSEDPDFIRALRDRAVEDDPAESAGAL